MVTLLNVITTLKWISTFALVVVVAIGTWQVDKRFTMLLLPPAAFYMSFDTGEGSVLGYVSQIPAVMMVRKIFDNLGPTGQKIFLATSGVLTSLFLFNPDEFMLGLKRFGLM